MCIIIITSRLLTVSTHPPRPEASFPGRKDTTSLPVRAKGREKGFPWHIILLVMNMKRKYTIVFHFAFQKGTQTIFVLLRMIVANLLMFLSKKPSSRALGLLNGLPPQLLLRVIPLILFPPASSAATLSPKERCVTAPTSASVKVIAVLPSKASAASASPNLSPPRTNALPPFRTPVNQAERTQP